MCGWVGGRGRGPARAQLRLRTNTPRPSRTRPLQVTSSRLDAFEADLWTLTPPCQPFTTTTCARQRDTADPRAASLLHLLELLPAMKRLPGHVLLENVAGFIGSGCHARLLAVLQRCGYRVQQFVISPHQARTPDAPCRDARPTASILGARGGKECGAAP